MSESATEALPVPKTDLMGEYDRHMREQEGLGAELDRQMMQTFSEWDNWTRTLPWADEKTREGTREYFIVTGPKDGQQRRFAVANEAKSLPDAERRQLGKYAANTAIVVTEYDENNKPIGVLELFNWNSGSDVKNPVVIAYADREDINLTKKRQRWNAGVQPRRMRGAATTVYGHRCDTETGHLFRDRYVGKEGVSSPIDIANDTLKVVRDGQITHRITNENYLTWEAVPSNQVPSVPTPSLRT